MMLLIFFVFGMSSAINIHNEILDFDSIAFSSSRTPTGRLIETEAKGADGEAAGLIGPVWQWTQTLFPDGKTATPGDPKGYTVQWLKDGTLSVKADCNRKGGGYSVDGDTVSLAITHSTMAACPEGSLEGRFTQELAGTARVVLSPDARSLELQYDGRTMTFSRSQAP